MANIDESILAPGKRLDGTEPHQYEIMSVLGHGGFGITYKAYNHLLATEVAIKEYFPSPFAVRKTDGSTIVPRSTESVEDYQWGLERFLDEARTLKLFDDAPNIVRVENFLKANGTAYIVMKYKPGKPLDQLLSRDSTLNEEHLMGVLLPVLDGLRVIHAENFFHRDIKPANIYIPDHGEPFLLDFGGARQALGQHSQSVTGIYTPGYTPIEQYSNRAKLTPATDFYALGATLYHCITGLSPVDAPERNNAHLEGDHDPLVSIKHIIKSGYRPELLETIDWMLQFRVRERPQSVQEILERLNPPKPKPEPEPIDVEEVIVKKRSAGPVENHHQEPTKPSEPTSTPNKKSLILAFCVLVVIFKGTNWGHLIDISEKPKAVSDVPSSLKDNSIAGTDSKAKEEQSKCRQLAGLGISMEKIKVSHALTACQNALVSNPGSTEIQSLLSRVYAAKKDYQQALTLAKLAATQGNAAAQNILGYLFFNGYGAKKDDREAVAWYRKAAEQNDVTAQNNLRRMQDEGVKEDFSDYVAEVRKRAEQGVADAQYQLGLMYESGNFVEKDAREAVAWYRKAAEQGNVFAQIRLGRMYLHGEGVEKDVREAAALFRKGAEQGYEPAKHMLESLLWETQ